MTRYEKIAISLPAKAAEGVRAAVKRGDAPSVSAYVAAAVEEKTKNDDLRALLDEMLAETGGPLTDAEKRAADRALGITKPRKPVRNNKVKDYSRYLYSLDGDGNVVREDRRRVRGKARHSKPDPRRRAEPKPRPQPKPKSKRRAKAQQINVERRP